MFFPLYSLITTPTLEIYVFSSEHVGLDLFYKIIKFNIIKAKLRDMVFVIYIIVVVVVFYFCLTQYT